MIYEMMNCEGLKDKSTSFIVGLELADEFVADLYDNELENLFYEYDDEEIEEILNNNEFFIVSRNYYGENESVEYFIEPLLHDGEQFYLDSDVVFIEDDLVDVVDFDKISGDEIFTLEIEEDEDYEEDFEDEYEEEEDCECDYCQGYDDGYNQAILEICELLNNKLKQ